MKHTVIFSRHLFNGIVSYYPKTVDAESRTEAEFKARYCCEDYVAEALEHMVVEDVIPTQQLVDRILNGEEFYWLTDKYIHSLLIGKFSEDTCDYVIFCGLDDELFEELAYCIYPNLRERVRREFDKYYAWCAASEHPEE